MPSQKMADSSPAHLKQYRPFRSVADIQPISEFVDEAKAVAASLAKELKERFGAGSVMLFGSLARGNFHKWSDIDLAVSDVSASKYYRSVAFASGFPASGKHPKTGADQRPQRINGLFEKIEFFNAFGGDV